MSLSPAPTMRAVGARRVGAGGAAQRPTAQAAGAGEQQPQPQQQPQQQQLPIIPVTLTQTDSDCAQEPTDTGCPNYASPSQAAYKTP